MIEPPRIAFDADHRRQLARVAAYHFLRTAGLIADVVDTDLITSLTFLTISRANIRELAEDWEAVRGYAALAAVPPDHLRRPVTVYAVARDLDMPYETVRRHVGKLRKAGMVEVGREGLIIPHRVYATAAQMQAVTKNWDMVCELIGHGIRFQLLEGGPSRAAVADVRRHAVRLSISFFLDSLTVLGRYLEQDALSVMVLLGIGRGNVGHFAEDAVTGGFYGSLEAIPPDAVRRPVSVYAVSKALRLPYETTRRYALRLVEQGWVERRPGGGLIVPASVVAKPGVIQGVIELADAMEAHLVRLVALGVPTDGPAPAAPV